MHEQNVASQGDRFRRQSGVVPRERLRDLTATVIGVGAIGRQVALQLAALGVPRLRLIDFDTVEAVNITNQGYRAADVGKLKVQAAADAVRQIDNKILVDAIADRFRPCHEVGEALFSAVDCIVARSAIWRSAGPRCSFWVDGRLLGDVIRVLAVAGDVGRDHYPTTLFDPGRAQRGGCGAGGTIYAAAVAAGLMVHQFVRMLRGIPIDTDVFANLLSTELFAKCNHDGSPQ